MRVGMRLRTAGSGEAAAGQPAQRRAAARVAWRERSECFTRSRTLILLCIDLRNHA
jgi:hypothetical protein